MGLSEPENAYLQRAQLRLAELRCYLNDVRLTEASEVWEWFTALARIKDIQGNFNNDVSFVACLLAKQYLEMHFGVTFDAAAKPQGAAGLDIDVLTPTGERLVAEIKTIVPYKRARNDLGAAQKKSFRADFTKLNNAQAKHKILFVTDITTFEVIKLRYAKEIPGVKIVLLAPTPGLS